MIRRTLLRSSQALNTAARSNAPFRSVISPLPALLRLQGGGHQARIAVASRWYSDAAEARKEEAVTEQNDNQNQREEQTAEAEDPSKKQLEAKEKEIIEFKDKYLRSVADFRNLQERTKREVSQAKDFAISRFARDLIESVDNLDRALTTVPAESIAEASPNQDLKNLHSGLKMTETILMSTLKKHGLERFDPSVEGDKFDPNVHDAVFQTPQQDKEDGTVFFTQQKGFKLNGRVVRAAKVGVVKNS